MSQAILAMSESDLARVVRDQIEDALAQHSGAPALLDRTRLAQALCCSPSHIDTLRKKGLPTVFVGEAPRFALSDVLAWLRATPEV